MNILGRVGWFLTFSTIGHIHIIFPESAISRSRNSRINICFKDQWYSVWKRYGSTMIGNISGEVVTS